MTNSLYKQQSNCKQFIHIYPFEVVDTHSCSLNPNDIILHPMNRNQ